MADALKFADRITSVAYRSLRTGRGYNNSAVEATARVEEADDPAVILAELRFWVDKAVDDTLKREDAYESLESIEASRAHAVHECERLEKRIKAYRELLSERHKLAELARANGLSGDALLLDHL